MARRRRSTPHHFSGLLHTKNQVRDDFSIASPMEAAFDPPPSGLHQSIEIFDDIPTSVRSTFPNVEDRRTYHPAGKNRPFNTPRRLAKIKPILRTLFSVRPILAFHPARYTMICVRRKMRREVIHALNKNGRGGQRKPRFNRQSNIRC